MRKALCCIMIAAGCLCLLLIFSPGCTPTLDNRVRIIAPDFLKDILDPAAKQFRQENSGDIWLIYESTEEVFPRALHDRAVDGCLFGGLPYEDFTPFLDSLADQSSLWCPFRLSFIIAGNFPEDDSNQNLTNIRQLDENRFERIVMLDSSAGFEGRLAFQFLERRRLLKGLWPKLIMARSPDQLVSYLSTGEADVAIALESTLSPVPDVKPLLRFDRDSWLQDRLIICGMTMPQGKHQAAAKAFLDFLTAKFCAIYDIPGVYPVEAE